MHTLRLSLIPGNSEPHQVEIIFEQDGKPLQKTVSPFVFALSSQEQEDLRWYLEDYLQYPLDPAPTVAKRIEGQITGIGEELFRVIFQQTDETKKLWAEASRHLNDTRVEVVGNAREGTTIPWELMRDPKTGVLLALRVPSFVRASAQTPPAITPAGAAPIRVLLVICRPKGDDDVPFRSVAKRLLKGLGEAQREIIRLEVLRPPTFEQLGHELRAARARGEQYHLVHFDGHGSYGDSGDGDRGYLMFENPALDENLDPVDGSRLGNLLAETDVPALILNACRSAHAAPPPQPEAVAGGSGQNEARTFGSLAQEVADASAGATGVVAMRYNVFVDTAAQFMADLYGSLAQGNTLGQAVTLGRKQLNGQPLRGIAFDPVPLQDWFVPVIYETAPIALFPKPAGAPKLTITLGAVKDQAAGGRALDPKLPPRPDAGFFGRDETLLALDRAFDSQSVVLLHAYAGSGKTTTAAEFARWYSLTGGVKGPVLFSSFERHKPLPRVLDDFGTVFQDDLERAGVQWGALVDPDNRREVALQVLQQVPVLWIWDNVEQVAGFPSGTESKWSAREQRELVDFLRAARDAATNVRPKFLLTSRRDEQSWLGDLPGRVAVPPMPFLERVELARALAEKHGRRLTDVQDWRPLLQFTQGNPMTLTVLVGQALRDGLRTRGQMEAFVTRLRKGEAVFKDEKSEGRTRSLGAALSYGFENAFTDAERRQLALLHLFQGFVDVDALRFMGNAKGDWHLPELNGMDREAGIRLLDRAAEVGLLTAYGDGYYSIHPALPWFFKKMFDEYYADSAVSATRVFAGAVASLGNYYSDLYKDGTRNVIGILGAEEANLLYARQLAHAHGWWNVLIRTMQGLDELYDHTGRSAEWARLVEEIVPDFVDPTDGSPLPGREDQWSLVTQYRVQLARRARKWADAERLQNERVEWNRQRASAGLMLPSENLDPAQRNRIRSLAASLHELAEIQQAMGRSECVDPYNQSYVLALRIQDKPGAAAVAFNLGSAYLRLPALRDLDQAERWGRQVLELLDETDQLGRAKALSQLGTIGYERFLDAELASKSGTEKLGYLNKALQLCMQGLQLTPSDATHSLGVRHNQIGHIYSHGHDIERSLAHYHKSIAYFESAGDIFGAALVRRSIAVALVRERRFANAREYALAALRNFEIYGTSAEKDVQRTLELIAVIDKAIKAQSGDDY